MSQHDYSQYLGWLPPRAGSGIGNFSLNAAANWMAFSFVPDANRTVTACNFVFRALTGTLAAGDVSCTIYSDTGSSAPNAAISAATTTVTPALTAPNLGLLVSFTGISQAVTAGTLYWAVLKNLNATPATNFPNWRYALTGTVSRLNRDFNGATSTNSGGAWTGLGLGVGCQRIDYLDGASDGAPLLQVGAGFAGMEAYDTREVGSMFTLPANVAPLVRGIAIASFKAGSPTGNMRFQLYQDTTLLGTTATIPPGRVSNPVTGGDALPLLFAAPISVPAGALVRLTVGTTTGGDASNYYSPILSPISNDATSKALLPFQAGGGIVSTYFNGSTWAQNDTLIPQMALVLDSDTDFNPPWPRRPGGISGGLQ